MPKAKKTVLSDQPLDGTIDLNTLNSAVSQIDTDLHIDTQTVKSMLTESLLKAYKDYWCQINDFPAENSNDLLAQIEVDWDKGTIQLYDCKEVKATDDDIDDDFTQIDLESARQIDPEAEVGNLLRVKVDPSTLGKVYIRKVVSGFHQRMREKAKQILMDSYAERIGHIITGTVDKYDPQVGYELRFENTTGLLGKRDILRDETFQIGDLVDVYLIGVTEREGHPTLNISRTDAGFVRALIAQEVPEIQDGLVKIVRSARDAGIRTKVMLASETPAIDPVGTCIGEGSVRARAVMAKLGKETVDYLHYFDDIELRIVEALRPARILGLRWDDPSHVTVIAEDNSKKVIVGRKGSNVRLAGKLCDRIEIRIVEHEEAIRDRIRFYTLAEISERARTRAAAKAAALKAQEEAQRAEEAEEAEAQTEEVAQVETVAPEVQAPAVETPAVEAPVEVAEAPVIETTPEPVKEVAKSAVEAPKPAVTPAPAPAPAPVKKEKEEEPVEHVTITGRAKVSLSALEQEVDRERSRKPSSRPNWRKRKEKERQQENKAETPVTKAPIQNAMPIYTEEELEEIRAQEEQESSMDYYSDIDDYDDDSYYDDDKRK